MENLPTQCDLIMTKVECKENMRKTMNGEMIDSLTVLIDGSEAYTWRKTDLMSLQSKNDADLKADVKRYLMGALRGKPDEGKAIDQVATKIKSLKL